MQVARWLHLLGVVVWVGGMFFAHMALRPAVQVLAPPERLPLLASVMTRFMRWAGVAIAGIVVSGIALLTMLGGMRALGWHVHAMIGLGVVMMLIYGHLAAGPLKRLRAAVSAGDWERAGAAMAQARRLIAINLVLGFLAITVVVLGR